ncbi:MAG: outer membrane beta-barrel protein [Alphaproteobacteria bacterium]
MRNLLLGAAAALMACALPSLASAQTGYADVSYSHASVDLGAGDNQDFNAGAVNGVAAFDLGEAGVQIGAGYANLNPDHGDNVDDWHAEGHVYKRTDNWQLGGGAAYSHYDGDGANADEWTVGAEALFFAARTTWGATLSYSDADDADLKETALTGEVRHFVSDNFSLGANVGYGSIDTSGPGGNDDEWSAGVGAEYQFANSPISVFGGYEHTDISDEDVKSDAVTIGARWNFGGSLFDRDRSGANLHQLRGVEEHVFGI